MRRGLTRPVCLLSTAVPVRLLARPNGLRTDERQQAISRRDDVAEHPVQAISGGRWLDEAFLVGDPLEVAEERAVVDLVELREQAGGHGPSMRWGGAG